MALTIRRTNNKELQERKQQIVRELCPDGFAEEYLAENIRRLRDLAAAGAMSLSERALYDELRRVEMLLDE